MHADLNCCWPVDSSFPTGFGLGACPKKATANFAGPTVPRPLILAWLHCMCFGLSLGFLPNASACLGFSCSSGLDLWE
jgi:hypothetical protein